MSQSFPRSTLLIVSGYKEVTEYALGMIIPVLSHFRYYPIARLSGTVEYIRITLYVKACKFFIRIAKVGEFCG